MKDLDFEGERISAAFGLEKFGFIEGYKSRCYFSDEASAGAEAPPISWQDDANEGVWLIRIGETNSIIGCELMVVPSDGPF